MRKALSVIGIFTFIVFSTLFILKQLTVDAFEEGYLVAEALEKYKEDHYGESPTAINDLVPRYLTNIDHDFHYNKSGKAGYSFCSSESDLLGSRTGHCWHWSEFDGSYVEFFD